MIKKIVVLASMALALVAMAAPAAQAETFWTNTGNFEATGNLTSERGGLVTGPALTHLQVTLANGPVMGEGEVTGGQITGVVPTNLPDCHAKGTINGASLNWPITLTTDPEDPEMGKVDISDVTFINHYTTTTTPGEVAGCAPFGVPAEVKVEGDVTGTVENTGENEVCINLNTTLDDLHVEGTGQANPTVDLTGIACIPGTEA